MRRVCALALLLSVLVGCTHRAPANPAPTAQALPDAGPVLEKAVLDTGQVKTVRLSVRSEGSAGTLGIRSVDSVITRDGEAAGTARLDRTGGSAELRFVVKGGTLYVDGLTGNRQSLPLSAAAAFYDPTAILDPARGLAEILRTATGQTQARETVDGVETLRIKATLRGQAVANLVPGVTQDVEATLWVAAAEPNLLHKVTFPVPGEASTVIASFSDFDAPASISAP